MFKKVRESNIFFFLCETLFLKMFFFFFKWHPVRRTRAQLAGCACAEKLTELVTRTPEAEWTGYIWTERLKGPVRVGHIVNGHYQRTEPEPGYRRMTSGPVSCVPLLAFVCHSVHVCNCDMTSAVLFLCNTVFALHCLHVCSLVVVMLFNGLGRLVPKRRKVSQCQ